MTGGRVEGVTHRSEVMNYDIAGSTITCQVIEYHPEPWNQWLDIGDLQISRHMHAVLSIGPHQLPCMSGENPWSGLGEIQE